jgi:hypothetical protein
MRDTADTGDASLTYGQLAKALGTTVTTVKSYRRKFPEFWLAESQGKPIRFRARTMDLCRAIQRHFKRGLSVFETRKRLSGEFETFGESPGLACPVAQGGAGPEEAPAAQAPQPADPAQGSLARLETLMEGLFSLQNRTHSLMAELVSKLDTLADRLGPGVPPAPPSCASGESSMPGSSAQAATGRAAGSGEPRPPEAFLDMPVVVRSGDGDYLGLNGRSGKPFTLGQFEAFLIRRAEGMGLALAGWLPEGQEWTLRLGNQGQTHDHHFLKAQTPKGNTVARFTALSVGGKPVSEAALQTFLRQVKETLDQ